MRFAILNSDPERRDGIKALLRQIDRIARFSEAGDWRQAERPLKRHLPDLMVIDWEPWMTFADIRRLLSHYPELRIAVLADRVSPASVRELMDEGVLGVIPRNTDANLIVRAFDIVLLGGHYVPPNALALNPPLTSDAATRPSDEKSLPVNRVPLSFELSARQEQIMRCVHMGSTNKMIARTLGISEGTVKIHLTSIFQQLGAPNRAAAVALYNGWLSAQLGVLRSHSEPVNRPVMGQPGLVPLRRRPRRRFQYALPADDTSIALPMAAEPLNAYGGTTPDTPEPGEPVKELP